MRFQNLIARLGIAGFEKIEPPIVIAWALGWPLRLIGRPGTAKTRLADLLSVAENGEQYYRRLDCPKENIVTMAGLPDIEAMKQGKFSFVHKTDNGVSGFVWDKRNITLNELTRMSAESANLLYELFSEGTFFGQPLPIQRKYGKAANVNYSVISTENPEGIGVRKMDPALFERFYMAVNVPDGQRVLGKEQRRSIVASNLERATRGEDIDVTLAAFAKELRTEYDRVVADSVLRLQVIEYGIALWESYMDSVQASKHAYISNRRQGMLTEIILGFVAYQRVTSEARQANLAEAADLALEYGVIMPVGCSAEDSKLLTSIHNRMRAMLTTRECSEQERFEADLLAIPSLRERITFLRTQRQEFLSLFKLDEREALLGKLLKDRQIEALDLLDIHKLLVELGTHEALVRNTRIAILTKVSKNIQTLWANAAAFYPSTFAELELEPQLNTVLAALTAPKVPPQAIRYLLTTTVDSLDVRITTLLRICQQYQAEQARLEAERIAAEQARAALVQPKAAPEKAARGPRRKAA
jgi:MoxR-like ATPase